MLLRVLDADPFRRALLGPFALLWATTSLGQAPSPPDPAPTPAKHAATESCLYTYRAEILRVVDGDTIDARIDVGFRMTTEQRLRLLGVNCPETKGATREAGLAASAYTRSAILGKTVLIRTAKSDVFGRWLAAVYLEDGTDFNASLLEKGFAVPFRE